MAKRSKIAAQHRREEVVARHAARRAELKEAQRAAASPEEAPRIAAELVREPGRRETERTARRVGAASSRCRAGQGDHTTTKDISSASALLAGSGPTWFRGAHAERGTRSVAPQPAGVWP